MSFAYVIQVRSAEHATGAASMLTNEAGEVTSHIQGLFNRTIRMMTNGIKPVYVFDGKPPTLKGGELAKRTKGRAKAAADLKAAEEVRSMLYRPAYPVSLAVCSFRAATAISLLIE